MGDREDTDHTQPFPACDADVVIDKSQSATDH
jgi:hypothetical protein